MRTAHSRSRRAWAPRWSSRKKRRRVGYRVGLGLGAVYLLLFISVPEGQVLAKGPTNPGHSQLGCTDCHDPAPGTLRQQLQALVAFGLGRRHTAPSIGRLPVDNNVCLDCHHRSTERHPSFRFRQPRFAEARAELGAHECISCHREHTGEHLSVSNEFCASCHSDMSLQQPVIQPTHEELARNGERDTCLRCHDFHGNHVREAPRSMSRALDLRSVMEHFATGRPIYGKKKDPALSERSR